MSINFQVGKYYRTVKGDRVRVVAIDGVTPYPVIGIVDGNYNGNWATDGGHAFHASVIVSEWINKPQPPWAEVPKWFKWFAMDASGNQYYYSGKPEVSGSAWWRVVPSQGVLTIPTDHRIPVACDWRDSLVERPTV